MYLEYWNLSSQPFESITDRAGLYPCEAHEGALMKLRYAIENQRGAAVLAGPAGTGKTLVANLLQQQLDARFEPFVRLVFPLLSSRVLLVYLAEELGAPPADPPRHTVEESVRRLQFYLAQNTHMDRHAVVVVDEAHLLEDCGALETLRLLLNFEVDAKPTLSLLLVGQMGLVSAIGRLPSLAESVAVNSLLRAFNAEETAGYITHRLRAAGSTRELFTPDALEAIHYLGHGIPRQINRLADLALLVGFADRLHELKAEQIEAVSEELVAISTA
jgi:type II secretory pathway predicted ATPase ExeA